MNPTPALAPALVVEGLRVRYGDTDVLHGTSATFRPGTLTAVVGPNGCGKSTLLRALARQVRPAAGRVLLDGRDVADLPARELARRVGFLPQSPVAPERLSVADLVRRGRDPHRRWYAAWTADDEAATADALVRTGLTGLAHRPVDELSGGQRQRAWTALLLAQRTDVLLLDEPTAALDVAHQLDVLELLARLAHEEGRTVVVVLHDLTLAARSADVVVALRDGAMRAAGSAADVLTPAVLAAVFDVEADVDVHPVSGRPVVVPHRRLRA